MMTFSTLFIDFNAFFASVAQHDEAVLRGRPVIITPLQSEHTSAIAVSYEARRFGIRRGTKVWEARQRCPEIAVRPARHDRYVVVQKQILAELERHLPLEKVYSIDEAAFRLDANEQRAEAAIAKARAMKTGLAEALGPALRSSIGIAASPLLAKLAAGLKKPDGITVLDLDDLPDRLADLPLEKIPGIGAGILARLTRAGIRDFPALWAIAPKQARQIWGSVAGERFWTELHGGHVEVPAQKKSMIGHSRVLTRDHDRLPAARIVARALLMKAASRLRHLSLFSGAMTLTLKARPGAAAHERVELTARFPATQDSHGLLRDLDRLWSQAMARLARGNAGAVRLRGVTVYLHGLCTAEAPERVQGDLFAEPAAAAQSEKRDRLWQTIDRINTDPDGRLRRLGRAPRESTASGAGRLIDLASQRGLDLNYIGTKIAFGRVPGEHEFRS